ncbi:YdeI/OmpD-associated family protein [Flavihumibacter sp. UBA7668]|uniref:YdeI/OmpD-associated family protein n=1 Tax=Flavihumibacter sp. UBA7668 TaxID=1946542 RepID=UPI0025BF3814|nr:YdeI/OmpD-associated family protein [Flavihumibacter sp. UBA7668]
MQKFSAILEIIGINPFVFVPDEILRQLFADAKKDKGPIPVCGSVNGKKYTQTLVKFKGSWRLYINTVMLPKSPERIGERISITIQVDKGDRTLEIHPGLLKALDKNKKAKAVFDKLTPSLQKEVNRYISALKTEESIGRNIELAIGFLLGKNRFIGREPRL